MIFGNFEKRIWDQRYLFALLATWTLLVILSAIWNLHENYRDTNEKAVVEARTIFQHNLAYRRWNSMHGGVYAKVTDINPPNPYIVNTDRDITGVNGTKLTMINPFQMTQQAYYLLSMQSPELAVFNRTVSLDPLNPLNEPDQWEREALYGFEDGRGELNEITSIAGFPYMRLISPYITEERCMGCHEHQGYEIGDIRGGMSIAVPMRPYLELATQASQIIVISHILLWLLGTVPIIMFFAGLKKFRAAILENEEKFRIVSEFAYNFEYWVNQDKELTFISPSCKRVTGYSRQDFNKNPKLMFDMIHSDDRGMFKNHLLDFEEETHEDMEYRIITKDGTIKWLSHICSPIYVDGNFLGRRGSNRDITEHKKLEEELIQAKKVECLGHFAGGVAHDFNNVLASISSLAQLIKEQAAKDDETTNEYIDYISIAAKLGKNLTSNMLLFGRKPTTNPQETKLKPIINNIENILQVLLPGEINFKKSLTSKGKPILADHHQIEQILINLATNGRDAMPQGGDLTFTTTTLTLPRTEQTRYNDIPAGDYMVLAVSDTGSGIKEEDLDNIFEPFYSTKADNKGTGLGLSIVHNIIKEHNGFIDIDSTINQGTTFRIFFPVHQGNDKITEEPISQSRPSLNKTIMVVDDDWLIRKSLLIYLQNKGYNVIIAADGEKAVNLFDQHQNAIDMVILDVMLPKKDGQEVYAALTREKPDLPVLFISGSTREVLADKNIPNDEATFLAKPLNMESLIAKIETLLA